MIFNRIQTKILNLQKTNTKAKYIVLSIPPALELYSHLININLIEEKIKFKELENSRLFGLSLVILNSNKEIVEVG